MAFITFQPKDHFNTKLYTGNGSVRTETGVGFQPDMVWIKDRTGTNNHEIADAVRGANYQIYPNLTNAQTNAGGHLTAFASDGFTLGTDGATNTNNSNYASWNWKANGQGSSNTAGSINTTYTSVNTTAGFSIITYTGTGSAGTIGHGLGVVPDFWMVKARSETRAWYGWSKGMSYGDVVNWSSNGAKSTDTSLFTSNAPTNQVINLGSSVGVNNSGQTFVCYAFTSIKGYSKFGSYTGNDNADGTFVYTGFKPAWIIRKNIDGGITESWFMEDNKRNTFNPANEWLAADASSAEGANNFDTDFLSNGFKMRSNNHGTNKGSTNYIYMAFAEEPLVANVGASIPATAR